MFLLNIFCQFFVKVVNLFNIHLFFSNNCLQVLNNHDDNLIEEKPRKSGEEVINYVNNKIIPELKEYLNPYWDCF